MSELQAPVKKEAPFKDRIREHLTKTIRHYLGSLDNGRLPRDASGTLQVLSVGCGGAYEAKPIFDIFRNTHFKGIDIDSTTIDNARRVNSDIQEGASEFSVEDARKIDDVERNKYGLVIIRHPQVMGRIESVEDIISEISESSQEWKSIITTSVDKTAPHGFLILTTDSGSEKDRIISYLNEANVRVLISEVNQASEFEGFVFKDSIVVIGQKV